MGKRKRNKKAAPQNEGKSNKTIRESKETASDSSTSLIPGMLKYSFIIMFLMFI